MKPIKTFHDTVHFEERAKLRGFSLEEAKDCVHNHDTKTRQGPGANGGFREKFIKTFGNRTLHVIAEVKKADCWLITGYWQ